MTSVSAIKAVTVGVSDLEAALKLFRDEMALKIERDFAADPSLLSAWQLGETTRARIVELSCKSYPYGRLRLVEYSPAATEKVRVHSGPGPHDAPADVGPKAIDFYIPAPMRPVYDRIVAAGYETRSEPVLHEVGTTVSEEFVFWGPDGVPLLLMVGHRHEARSLRPGSPDGPYSEVATVSVVGGSIERTREFYEGVLGLDPVMNDTTPEEFVEKANELTGLPPGTSISWLLYVEPGEPSGKILVLHFGGEPGKRLTGRMRPGRLGFSLLTHRCADVDALVEKAEGAGYPAFTPVTSIPFDGEQRRIALIGGPNEELFEFVQA